MANEIRPLSISLLSVLCCMSVWAQDTVGYQINGTAPTEVDAVFLNTLRGEPIDTCLVENGKFRFVGEMSVNSFVTIVGEGDFLPVNLLIDGSPVEVNLERGTLRGSKINERLNKVDRQITDLTIDYMQDQMEYAQTSQSQKEVRDSLRKVLNVTYSKLIVEMKNVIRANPDNVIPALYLSQIYNTLSIDELKEYLDNSHVYASHPLCAGAWRMLNHYEKTNIGNRFTDLVEADTAGVSHRLSEYVGKGKLVLVDFWASWCAPCMLEMDNLKVNYKKYRDKGFEIVGLSFDRGRQPWIAAIESHHLDWVHLSDLKYWNSEASIVYGISSIPANLLVNGDGTIIATDLRGEELGKKLKEIFKY